MLFQVLDNKNGCVNFYCDGSFEEQVAEKYNMTWKQNKVVGDRNVDYAQIYALGQELDDACPEHLKVDWLAIQAKMHNFYISFQIAKLNLDDVCFYDLLPQKFLIKYCNLKNDICKWVFENYEKPENYDLIKNIVEFVANIESRELNLNWDKIDPTNVKSRAILKKKAFMSKTVRYDPWKTKTGRLATTFNSFPILTMNKESRAIIEPQNDLFLELDYNSAELRVAFGLLGMDQPTIDIHDWILETVFNNKISREKSKEKTFAWLYNMKASNKKLEKIFDKQKILDYCYDGQSIKTLYNRKIAVEERKALNYVIQSTTSDLVLKQAIKISKLLEKSFIAFIIHDSIVIDVDQAEKNKLNEIIEIFSDTDFGKFKTNISLGKDFGNMRKI